MGQEGNVWTNDMKPVNAGGTFMCPVCGGEIAGPFSAVMGNNKVVRKWGCTQCRYVYRIESGAWRSAHEANPVEFK